MPEKILSNQQIIDLLWRDGYHAAAKLLEESLKTVSETAEFNFILQFVSDTSLDEELGRDQLRMLWTSYCLHQNLLADTWQYDNQLMALWKHMEQFGDGTSEWSDYDGFGEFMARYLV